MGAAAVTRQGSAEMLLSSAKVLQNSTSIVRRHPRRHISLRWVSFEHVAILLDRLYMYFLRFTKVGILYHITRSLGSFLGITTRRPVSANGLSRVSPYEAGPSLAWEVEEASAGNGRAQSRVPTFMERRKYMFTMGFANFYLFSTRHLTESGAEHERPSKTQQKGLAKKRLYGSLPQSTSIWHVGVICSN